MFSFDEEIKQACEDIDNHPGPIFTHKDKWWVIFSIFLVGWMIGTFAWGLGQSVDLLFPNLLGRALTYLDALKVGLIMSAGIGLLRVLQEVERRRERRKMLESLHRLVKNSIDSQTTETN